MAMSPDPVRMDAAASWSGRRTILSGNALAVASMITWAAGFPAAEILLESWPPLTLVLVRLALGLVMLIPVWILIDGPRRVLQARWGRALWVGGLGFGMGTWLVLLAQKFTDPVTVTLIVSCAPLMGMGLELLSRSRTLSWRVGLGVLASVIGGLIATSALSPAQLGLGAACAVVSTGLFTWASMVTARDFTDLSQTGRTAITFTGGMVAIAGLWALSYLWGVDLMPRANLDLEQAGMLAIYALVATAFSQVLFISSVGKLGVAVATFHINVTPFYVMVILMILGAGWNWTQALGAAIVALGVILAQGRGTLKVRA